METSSLRVFAKLQKLYNLLLSAKLWMDTFGITKKSHYKILDKVVPKIEP